MQNFAQCPVFSDVADWFAYPALTSNNGTTDSKNITFTAANGTAKAYITLQPEHYFLCTHFAAKTNYDNFGGVFKSANVAAAVIAQPSTPNTFLVEMSRSSNNYANIPLTQAEVCSSGGLSGKQNPYGVIYGPSITLSFNFTDLTGFLRLTEADAAVPLSLQFWMVGYAIPQSFDGVPDSNFNRFLKYFPALEREYNAPSARVSRS